MDIDLRAVVGRLVMNVDVRLPGGLLDNVPAWFVERRAADRRRWRGVFGCEVATLTEARRDGWRGIEEFTGLAGTMVALLLPDGRIGLATDDVRLIPPPPAAGAVVDEVLAAVLEGGRGRCPEGVRQLPAVLHDALVADGLSPDGFRALGSCLNDVSFAIGGMTRCARLGLSFAGRNEAIANGEIVDGRPVREDVLEWRDVEVRLSRRPSILATPSRVKAEVDLPGSVLSELPGRPAASAIDHPALARMEIVRATARRSGFTITIKEGGRA